MYFIGQAESRSDGFVTQTASNHKLRLILSSVVYSADKAGPYVLSFLHLLHPPTLQNGSTHYPRRTYSGKASLGVLADYRTWYHTPDSYWSCWRKQSLWGRYLAERRPQCGHCCYQSGNPVSIASKWHHWDYVNFETVCTNELTRQHGEISCIQQFYAIPQAVRPKEKDCIFFATHEPCSLCQSHPLFGS
jgi:hypothetical protein